MNKNSDNKKLTPEEKRANRKEFLNDPVAYLFKPTIQYWKKHPFLSLGQFFLWVFIFYGAFTTLQAINYDMIYCNSTLEQYNGKILRTYNPFVAHVNQVIEEMKNDPTLYNKQYSQFILGDIGNITSSKYDLSQYKIICKYDLNKWYHEDTDFLFNLQTLGVRRYFK